MATSGPGERDSRGMDQRVCHFVFSVHSEMPGTLAFAQGMPVSSTYLSVVATLHRDPGLDTSYNSKPLIYISKGSSIGEKRRMRIGLLTINSIDGAEQHLPSSSHS